MTTENAANVNGLITVDYQVSGMHCAHCATSVTEEVSEIDGVTAVDVDVESGRVTVTSTQPLAVVAVQAAVDEAGYQLVS